MIEYIIDMSNSIYTSQDNLIHFDFSNVHEEIVRCRDCKHYEGYTGCCTRRDNIAPMAATPDGFCAWGERG